jgi:uncharacterized protein YceH (UPF0502 family)
MSDSTSSGVRERAWQPLEAVQRRVLGALVEKAKTTPAGYPMSLNAVVIACNQKNNRDPLTAYDEVDVGRALSDLAEMKAASEIDWMGRVPKYKHHAHEWLGVTPVELAVMTELLLRGPQTPGDLRARASRMETIADQGALKDIVEGLLARGLMVELTPPGRGQVVAHALYLGPELDALRASHAGGVRDAREPMVREPMVREPRAVSGGPLADDFAALKDEMARLSERVAALEARLGKEANG